MIEITKPCPFCGTPARAEDVGHTANSETLWNDSEVIRRGGRSYSVLCRRCGACGPESTTEKEAITEWNHAKWIGWAGGQA